MVILVFIFAIILALSATGAVGLLVYAVPNIPIAAIPVSFIIAFVILFVLTLIFYLVGRMVEQENRRADLRKAIIEKAREERLELENETLSIPSD